MMRLWERENPLQLRWRDRLEVAAVYWLRIVPATRDPKLVSKFQCALAI